MRTLVILLGGFVLWGACLGVARALGGPEGGATWRATAVFAVLWLVLAAANLWVGVFRAGYSFREELPIFLLIFLVPVAAAFLVKWRFL